MAFSPNGAKPYTFTYLSCVLIRGTTFGTSDSAFVRFLLYMATQLLWFLPIIGFFTSLNAWRCGYNKRSIAIAIISLLISIGGIIGVFC